jgi:hypothetical protein
MNSYFNAIQQGNDEDDQALGLGGALFSDKPHLDKHL